MRRSLSRLLGLVAVALPAGTALAVSVPPGAIEIVSPRAGDALVAGGKMRVEWRADDALAFEEWEAFLSLDGGATWPLRLTPHLDRRLRRVEVDLPEVPTRDARLLLRFGDEREERELELAARLTITEPASRLALERRAPVRYAAAPGEAARPGVAGVAEWVEGPRDGSRIERVRALDGGRFADGARLVAGDESLAALPPEPVPQVAPSAAAAASPRFVAGGQSLFTPLRASSSTRRLSILQRWNR